MKRFLIFLLSVLSLFLFSCSEDDDDFEELDISEIYGYTYSGTIYASSGNVLTPEITIFNGNRLDWNMSSTGMKNNQFYYTSEKTALNKYKMLWFSTSDTSDERNASMTVYLGINSKKSVAILVDSAGTGAGDSMAGTRVNMARKGDEKNTTPTSSGESETVEIPEISVAGESAEWFENSSSYSGKMAVVVGGSDYGDGSEKSVTVTKTDGNTVTVKNPASGTTIGMDSVEFDIEGVDVTKDGDVYYLSKSDFSVTAGGTTYSCSSFTGRLEGGVLTFVLVYTPGAMPMPITEVFTSN